MDPDKLYTVQEIPGKGLGLVAASKIAKGTRIISETPLVLVSKPKGTKGKHIKTLSKNVAALSDAKRLAFFSLHNAFEGEMKWELGIVRTNALPLGPGVSAGGVFLESARINHACLQNAQDTWNEDLKQLTIHAIRNIDKDEEITITYLDERLNHAARHRTLQHEYRFTCPCQLCCLSFDQRGRSDVRLGQIQRLGESIRQGDYMSSSPLKVFHSVHELLQLCVSEGLADRGVAWAYDKACEVAIFHGDIARARVLAQRSLAFWEVLEGHDSPRVRQVSGLVKDPTKHNSYGGSSRWTTSTSDIPTKLPAKAFESWLWKSHEVQHYADLRDSATFPPFEDFPDENDLDLEFFATDDGLMYRPRKHWCLLAEIVDLTNLIRLVFIVEDKDGHKAPVPFYTDSCGSELDSSLVRKGFTVAMLYPQQHGFLDMTTGIRHENPPCLKIFPVALKELFTLSDKVQEYAAVAGGEKTCQGCDRKAPKTMRCAKCNMFYYCDKACQALAWRKKGHKGDCKLLRDVDLQLLLRLGREGFGQHLSFSTG